LHRLPTPRPGQVLGLVGSNGTGKTTALRVLAGKLKPNLGKYSVKKMNVLLFLLGILFRHRPIGKIY